MWSLLTAAALGGDAYVGVDLPAFRTASVDLDDGSPTLAPSRTPIDFGLAVGVLPSDPGWFDGGSPGAMVSARWQRTRWSGGFDPPFPTDVLRVEADLLWVMHLAGRVLADEGLPGDGPTFTPVLTFGGGGGVALFERWVSPGAHAELSAGVRMPLGPTVDGLARVRVAGFLHPWGYGRFDAGPTTTWNPSEVVAAVQFGVL